MTTPFKYLGMMVGECHKKGVFWGGVVERLKTRLGRWKGSLLSMTERIWLIKFVLSSILLLLLFLSLYKMPIVVLKKIERIKRNF